MFLPLFPHSLSTPHWWCSIILVTTTLRSVDLSNYGMGGIPYFPSLHTAVDPLLCSLFYLYKGKFELPL